jgi:folate-dependent phosphoribosylglycinamide formyltransferase PurN
MDRLRIALLCSHRAPGLTYLIDRDANHARLYDLVCCVTSEDAFAEQNAAARCGIPVIRHPIRRFCRTRGWRLSDPAGRAVYDHTMAERLSPYRVDLVVLTGYLRVLTEPMLAAFRHRIVNIHHADLTLRTGDGRPRLPGLRAVRDALLEGLPETRATVHLVTRELDQGPPFLRSWPFPVSPLVSDALASDDHDVIKAYAYAHQEWMIRATWGPLAAAAVELVARRRLNLRELADIPPDRLDRPWDLDEDGWLHGRGPLGAKEDVGPIVSRITEAVV